MNSVELMILPEILEKQFRIRHTQEIVTLDRNPYSGDLLQVDYGLTAEVIANFKTEVPEPRANTYVLNLKSVSVDDYGDVNFYTNYTNMRSQFALRRWLPELAPEDENRNKIWKAIQPLGVTMLVETIDNHLLIELRGKNVQNPGIYNPAPAGGVETRDYHVIPNPFRCIQGEAWEEMGVLPGGDYGLVSMLGISRGDKDANPNVTFHAQTKTLTLEEVKELGNNIAPEAGEHQELLGMPTEPNQLIDSCVDMCDKFSGNGLGSILIFGYHRYELTWLDEAITQLGKKDWRFGTEFKG